MRMRWLFPAALIALAVTGCANEAIERASLSPSKPWVAQAQPRKTGGPADFSVPAEPKLAQIANPVLIDPEHAYDLAGLIDIAQRSSPATRHAWEVSRQAALASGMVEASFLPLITASVIGGVQKNSTPVDVPLVGRVDVESTLKGVTPVLALQWLVFDFGQRAALSKAARQVSFASNVTFNAAHQKLIFDVTRRYYEHGAAIEGHRIAAQTLANSKSVLRAVEAQLQQGRATAVELALARQQLAQSELRLVRAGGQQQDSYQALLGAMGVNATVRLKVAAPNRRQLPARFDALTQTVLESAMQRRPDLLAAYAALKAGEAQVEAAKAGMMPKIVVAGTLASNSSRFHAGNLSDIGSSTAQSSVLVVASVPLFDGGLRAAQVKTAQAGAAAAAETFRQVQLAAISEIVIASNVLETTLAANKAAGVLVQTSATAFDAALEAYRNGLGTIVIVNEANSALLDARLTKADAEVAVLISAANLAFFTGALTSVDKIPGTVMGR
ncbi:TolC family protein [Aquamicrobium segne]|uniref:Protein CyaE n=1 Tax=Aquamicrobium segne TaxID=469547 RepID=A0ABW0H2M2_9HYPH